MTFADFIKRHYTPIEQADVCFLLHNFSIYSNIESAFNDFCSTVKNGNSYAIIPQLVLTIREFVLSFYKPLCEVHYAKTKGRREKKIVGLVKFLLLDTYKHSALVFTTYYNLFIETARKTYLKSGFDFSVLEEVIYSIEKDIRNKNRKGNIASANIDFPGPVKLDWHGGKQLDLFVDDLHKTFQDIRCKKPLYCLFDHVKKDFKIELSSRHLLPFLTLFYVLHESGAIKVVGNRGLFVYLRRHLQAPANDRYPKRDFRKLRHEAEQNGETKKNIFRKINPLLEKYCLDGR